FSRLFFRDLEKLKRRDPGILRRHARPIARMIFVDVHAALAGIDRSVAASFQLGEFRHHFETKLADAVLAARDGWHWWNRHRSRNGGLRRWLGGLLGRWGRNGFDVRGVAAFEPFRDFAKASGAVLFDRHAG